jgi:hypothetical protein
MPYAYVQPEEAFEIRIQCTEEEIQKHCLSHNFPDPLTFWYTLDINESEDNEFDIRMMPNFPMKHDPNNPCYGMSCNDHAVILQAAINKGLVSVDGCTIDIMENNN